MLENVKANTRKVLLILDGNEEDFNTYLSSRNIDNVLIAFSTEVLLDVLLNAKSIITTEKTLKVIEGRLA